MNDMSETCGNNIFSLNAKHTPLRVKLSIALQNETFLCDNLRLSDIFAHRIMNLTP